MALLHSNNVANMVQTCHVTQGNNAMRALPPALLFTMLLTACASSGPVISDPQLAALQPGKTSRADILRDFGRPSFHSDNLDGTVTSAYLQPGHRGNAAAMVSLVGALASGGRADVNAIIFRFDSNGRLNSYEKTSESAAHRKTAAAVTDPQAGSTTSSAAAPTSAAPRPARPARSDQLPDWLPSSSTRDPRDPH